MGFRARTSFGIENSKESNLFGLPKVGKIDDNIRHNKGTVARNKTNITLNWLIYIVINFRDLGDLMSSGCIKSSKYVVIILVTMLN